MTFHHLMICGCSWNQNQLFPSCLNLEKHWERNRLYWWNLFVWVSTLKKYLLFDALIWNIKRHRAFLNEAYIISYLKYHDWRMIFSRFWQKLARIERFDFFFLYAQDFFKHFIFDLLRCISKSLLIFQTTFFSIWLSILKIIFLFNWIVNFLFFFAKYLLKLNFASSHDLIQSSFTPITWNYIQNDAKVQIAYILFKT